MFGNLRRVVPYSSNQYRVTCACCAKSELLSGALVQKRMWFTGDLTEKPKLNHGLVCKYLRRMGWARHRAFGWRCKTHNNSVSGELFNPDN